MLLHGLFGSGDNLRAIARGLEDQFQVILPDLPNHGTSSHIGSSTHEAMVDSIAAFLREHVPGRPVVGGHSIGGKLAMLLCLREPDSYPALVSIDMAPRPYQASHLEILEGMRGIPMADVKARRDADEMLAPAVPDPGVRGFLLKNLVRDNGVFRWRLDLEAIERDYDNMLGWRPPSSSFEGPSLFVGGDRSRYFQADRDTDLIRQWFPSADIHTIQDAGHWLHADKPAEVVQVIRSFLLRVDLP